MSYDDKYNEMGDAFEECCYGVSHFMLDDFYINNCLGEYEENTCIACKKSMFPHLYNDPNHLSNHLSNHPTGTVSRPVISIVNIEGSNKKKMTFTICTKKPIYVGSNLVTECTDFFEYSREY